MLFADKSSAAISGSWLFSGWYHDDGGTRGTFLARFAGGSGLALASGVTRGARVPGIALRAGLTLGARIAGVSLCARLALITSVSMVSGFALVPGIAGVSLVSGRACRAWWPAAGDQTKPGQQHGYSN